MALQRSAYAAFYCAPRASISGARQNRGLNRAAGEAGPANPKTGQIGHPNKSGDVSPTSGHNLVIQQHDVLAALHRSFGANGRHLPPIFSKKLNMEIFPLAKTDLGPAAKALVEKIASAIGTVYAPLGTILQAAADVSADKIKAEGRTEVDLVRRRGLERLAAEETKKQNNLEAVYGKTFQLLDPGVSSTTIEQIDEDLIVFHSEKARLVSDKEMQILWARVLASEAEVPGSFSKRTLEILSVLEKTEAHLFTSVCRFVVQDSQAVAAILQPEPNVDLPTIYTEVGLNTEALLHLSTIGLVQYDFPLVPANDRLYDGPVVDVQYFGDCRTFVISKQYPSGKYFIDFGVVGLTKVGRELAKIAGAEPVEGFFDFLEAEWAKARISRQL
jgi:hypothetical protein